MESIKNILTYLGPGQDLGRKGHSGFLQVFCRCEEIAANIKTQRKGTLLRCEGERALALVAQVGCGFLKSPFSSLEDNKNLYTVLGKQLKVSCLNRGLDLMISRHAFQSLPFSDSLNVF